MSNKSALQRFVEKIPYFFTGVLFVGAVLDGYSNVVAVLNPTTAFWASIVVVAGYLMMLSWVKAKNPTWLVDGKPFKLTALNWRVHAPFIGALAVVWLSIGISWFVTSPRIVVESIVSEGINVNDIMVESGGDEWKHVSGDEVSKFTVNVKNSSTLAANLSHGILIIDKFEDPVGENVPISQMAYHWINFENDPTFVAINELKIGEAAMFPIDKTIQPGLREEVEIWFRLLAPSRPQVTFIEGRVRIFDRENRFSDSEPFKMSIHRASEELFNNEKPN